MNKVLDFILSTVIFTVLILVTAHQWAKEDATKNSPPVYTYTATETAAKTAPYIPPQEIPGRVEGFRYIPPEKDYSYTAEELAVWVPVGEFSVTAYCPCEQCCGVWAYNRPNGVVYTASGEIAQAGVTVGTDWNVLPAGSRILIDGVGEYTVHDNGEPKGNVVDVYHNTHAEALAFAGAGKRQVYVRKAGEIKHDRGSQNNNTSEEKKAKDTQRTNGSYDTRTTGGVSSS